MTLSNRRSFYILLCAAFAAGGCRSTGEPLALLLRGNFVLRTVNGGPLPADVSTRANYQITLLDRTLQFDGKGLARMSQTVRVQGPTSAPAIEQSTANYRVRFTSETIYLDFLCPPNANCITSGPTVAHLVDANTVVLGDSQRYVYVRR